MPEIIGKQDEQTVLPNGQRAPALKIAGVRILELSNILTRSGWMTEIFRTDWSGIQIEPRQINWVELGPHGVTDWHRHAHQTDHLVGVGGVIKLALCDGRPDSPTRRATEVVRIGAIRPVMVIVPPGVWHALRNESGQPAGFLTITDQLFMHERPDNWRLSADDMEIPSIL
jgi:dTDP-4-dehydrorhamnose 3,5-epimerase